MSVLPETPAQWQDAVDAAEGALMLDSARKYGFVKGGPEVNTERAEEMLELGREHGYKPAPNATERFIAACMSAATR